MIINKHAWHYRMLIWLNKKPSPSLCAYFWQVVSAVAWPLIALCATIYLVIYFTGIFAQLDWVQSALVFIFFVGLWNVMCVLFNIAAYIAKQIGSGVSRSVKKNGLLSEYLKARKNKVCPLIEFRD